MAERSNAAVLSHGDPFGKNLDTKGPEIFYVYILKSSLDNGYYYGYCADLIKRIKQHNAGKVRSTKSRRPFTLHYNEEFASKSEAAKREYFFKTIEGYKYLKAAGII